jgi:hypothetical protein
MIRTILRVLLLTIALSTATRVFGWWGVPLTAALWGVLSTGDGTSVAVAAGLAWAALLGHDAALGRLGMLASDIGRLFGLPPAVLIVLTLLYPMLLAWSAAVVSGAVTGARKSRATSPHPAQ